MQDQQRIPPIFLCNYSSIFMNNPVQAQCGHYFEHSQILQYIGDQRNSYEETKQEQKSSNFFIKQFSKSLEKNQNFQTIITNETKLFNTNIHYELDMQIQKTYIKCPVKGCGNVLTYESLKEEKILQRSIEQYKKQIELQLEALQNNNIQHNCELVNSC